MIWIVVKKLRELRPLVYYMLAGILFVLAQLTFFLLSRPICNGTNAKIDGSFLATAMETASVIVLYLAWQGITEGSSISRRVCEPICSSTVRWQTTGERMYTSNRWRGLFYCI
jgi:Chitin synthase export chaperone